MGLNSCRNVTRCRTATPYYTFCSEICSIATSHTLAQKFGAHKIKQYEKFISDKGDVAPLLTYDATTGNQCIYCLRRHIFRGGGENTNWVEHRSKSENNMQYMYNSTPARAHPVYEMKLQTAEPRSICFGFQLLRLRRRPRGKKVSPTKGEMWGALFTGGPGKQRNCEAKALYGYGPIDFAEAAFCLDWLAETLARLTHYLAKKSEIRKGYSFRTTKITHSVFCKRWALSRCRRKERHLINVRMYVKFYFRNY